MMKDFNNLRNLNVDKWKKKKTNIILCFLKQIQHAKG